jgi:hypothetical protein
MLQAMDTTSLQLLLLAELGYKLAQTLRDVA